MAQLLLCGKPLGDFDGVLFDKDGTLSHSEPRLVQQGQSRVEAACACLLAQGQARGHDMEANITRFRELLLQAYGLVGSCVSPEGLLAVASRQHNLLATATLFSLMGESWPQALVLSEQSFENASRARQSARDEAKEASSPLLPDAGKIIHRLQETGVTCAVISNDTRAGIERFLTSHQLNAHISGIWSADDHPNKPDPSAVHALCEQLALKPERCVLIGDADSDLLMARRAGIGLSLGYVAGWTRSPNLTHHEKIISHWEDLEVVAP